MIRDAASRLSFAPSRYILVAMSTDEQLFIGLVSISDRASQGVYKDEGIPALEEWFKRVLTSPSWRTIKRLIWDQDAELYCQVRRGIKPGLSMPASVA